VCPTGGRLALLAAWGGARAGRLPLILWASLWAHPRSAAHALSYLPLRSLYRSAEAVVTYGPHVSDYVTARGARNVHIAPQSVDNRFWGDPAATVRTPASPLGAADAPAQRGDTRFMFVGRAAPEKGIGVLLAAWRAARLARGTATLVLVGVGSDFRAGEPGLDGQTGAQVLCMDTVTPPELRDLYAAADVLVVPSVATRTFREPWGLVVNEAMNRELAVIASDAVGAVAGGLVRDGENGLVVRAGDPLELAAALERLAGDPKGTARMGAAGALAVQAYDHDAWAAGFSRALATVGLSRAHW
jgi:glycosyltransferase involved in cell wall biosynthesis